MVQWVIIIEKHDWISSKQQNQAMKTVLLTNFIPPYRIPLYKLLAEKLNEFEILISTPMEPNRPWHSSWEGLPVTVSKTVTFRRKWKHPAGFQEDIYIHIPVDTLYLLVRKKPEVVISGEMGFRTIQAVIYKKFINPKTKLLIWATLSDRTEQGRGLLRYLIRKWILRNVDGVIVNGKAGQRYIQSFGFPHEHIFRVPQTTDVSKFISCSFHRVSSGGRRLIYVGQLIPRKGLVPFTQVLAKWSMLHPEKNIEMWFVGDGPTKKELSSIICPPNLTLKFLGNMSYDELPNIYAQCDILVFPTLADEWGMVVNEAMAAGLPVLGSLYSQAVEELVEDGVTGWVFRPDHPNEIFNALDRALSIPDEDLEIMRKQARYRALELTPEKVCELILQAIRHVTNA